MMIGGDKIAYCDLSRDFKLETVTLNMILLSSVRHRLFLVNGSAFNNVKYEYPYLISTEPLVSSICNKEDELTSQNVCVTCYFKTYKKQEHDRQLVEWIGKEYKACIEIYEKTQDTFYFQVVNIEKIPCEWCDSFLYCNVHKIHKREYDKCTPFREQGMRDLLNTNFMFIVCDVQWMDEYMREEPYMRDNIIAIRREFAAKLMIIRDFVIIIPLDIWRYVIDILIESEKTREVTFV
jgi:hypothetical protein